MTRPADLPEFENPPVVEVALSVQFEPLPLTSKHLALLWEKHRDEFQDWQDHPPIAPSFELFGPGSTRAVTWRMGGGGPLPRAIFRNTDGTGLKQYQPDRFVRNWAKASGTLYPRYESVRAPFETDLHELVAFASEQSLGEVVPNQCEVTYVNLIPLTGSVSGVISPWSGTNSDSFLGEPESLEIGAHFTIEEPSGGEPVGRLHISGTPVVDQGTGARALQLTLTARGQCITPGLEGVLKFLDLGRQQIVKGFASFTDSRMHQAWGRRYAG